MHLQSRKKKSLEWKKGEWSIRTTLASHHEFPLSLCHFEKKKGGEKIANKYLQKNLH